VDTKEISLTRSIKFNEEGLQEKYTENQEADQDRTSDEVTVLNNEVEDEVKALSDDIVLAQDNETDYFFRQ
jgi:hypothetical protein